MRRFFAMGTPRSRTAWLARFLSTPTRQCLHEPSRRFADIDELTAFAARPDAAASDSMMTFRWREVMAAAPGCRIILVTRPLGAVVQSFRGAGLAHPQLWPLLERLSAECDSLARVPGVLPVRFDDLARREVCERVWWHAHGEKMPRGHWEVLAKTKITADVSVMLTDTRLNAAGIARVYPELREVA